MSSSQTPEDALLARLKALRTSHISMDTTKPPSVPQSSAAPQSTLDDRLRALRSTSESSIASIPRPCSPPPTPAPIAPKAKKQPKLVVTRPQNDHGVGYDGANDTDRLEGGKDNGKEQGGEVEKMKEDYTENASQGIDEALKYLKDQGHSPTEEDVDQALASAKKVSQMTADKKEVKQEAKPETPNKLTQQTSLSHEEYMRTLGFVAAETSKIAKQNLSRAAKAKALHALPHPDLPPGTDLEEYHQQFLEGFDDFADSEEGDEIDLEYDEDEEANTILAELMDDVNLNFTEDAETKEHDEKEDRLKKSSLGSPSTVLLPLSKPSSTSPPQQHPNHGKKSTEVVQNQDHEEEQSVEEDFQKVLAARMSALRTPPPQSQPQSTSATLDLPTAPSSELVDYLGLPSAPTARPTSGYASSVPGSISPKRIAPKDGYICAICYAPATIFCEGCEEEHHLSADLGGFGETKEDAMYCARCWKEGHMGESAGIEERGHTWVSAGLGK